jgi:hypothetical protein
MKEWPLLMEDMPLEIRHRILFQFDGAVTHVCNQIMAFFYQHYKNHWIGHHGPVTWLPSSQDQTPLHFFL